MHIFIYYFNYISQVNGHSVCTQPYPDMIINQVQKEGPYQDFSGRVLLGNRVTKGLLTFLVLLVKNNGQSILTVDNFDRAFNLLTQFEI